MFDISVGVCCVCHNLVKSRVQLTLAFLPDLPHLQKTGRFGECYYIVCGTADITSSSHRDISKKKTKKNVSDVLIRAENRVVSQLLE